MARMVRLFEGRFGRLVLTDLAAKSELRADQDPAIVLARGESEILLLNPGDSHTLREARRALVFHGARDWLREGFPAVFAQADGKPFGEARAPMTPRIRQLAETLAIEVFNDRFLSSERLEFMLQELVLSIVETYLASRRASTLWRGSRFEDLRIRRAIALLRAHPNKDLSMDELANQVGLSRSRFYDLFQLCTGFSPRTYLDLLCIEAAIARLSSGRGKIAELSAELGFSAQSNFTRFFLNRVGVPPSEYRRATSRPEAE
jgi:AraC-like DNA-binding protein